MELTSFCLALFLWCTFPKCFMEQIWMMCNMSNPSILILFICSQLLSHLFALEKRNLLCYLTCTVFPKISTMIFLINQKRFQGNVPFYQVFKELFILIKWLVGLPVVIKVINSKSSLLIDNRTCLPGQETEEVSSFPGEGRGSPLPYSCLETPMDREPGRLSSMGLWKVRHHWVTEQAHRVRWSYCPDCSKDVCEGFLQNGWAFLVAQIVKNLPAMWETWVRSLGWEDPLAKGKATHSSILAWRIPWTV